MVDSSSISRKIFVFFNALFLTILSLTCLLPFIYLLAISFSSRDAAATGQVILWPVEFTAKSYEYMLQKHEFIRSILISIERVFLGTIVNMLFTILTAYPLSKERNALRIRTIYVWFFVFTMLFSGGLIPTYMIVRGVGLLDTIWALVLPGALPVFNAILLLNFLRNLPKELEESAFIDGASHWVIMAKISIPLSLPALATIFLFTIVGHWNSWFDGMIFMQRQSNYPLSTYLQSIIIMPKSTLLAKWSVKSLELISDRTIKAAQIFIGTLPILAIYPFLQRYFMAGLVLGSVKE